MKPILNSVAPKGQSGSALILRPECSSAQGGKQRPPLPCSQDSQPCQELCRWRPLGNYFLLFLFLPHLHPEELELCDC